MTADKKSRLDQLSVLVGRLRQIDVDQLRQGWLLVPQPWLQEAITALAQRQQAVESASLTLEDGVGLLELSMRAEGLRPRAILRSKVRIEEFALTKTRGIAILVFDTAPDISVEAQGLFGRYGATAIARALERLFESEEAQRRLQTRHEIWELSWPRLTIYLDRIEAIRRLRDTTLAGLGLLDLVAFGPAEVLPEGIRIRVRSTGLGHAVEVGGKGLLRWLKRRRGG
ncbi:MAG: hypothetical protein D6761_02645 [Candidatus Dadabacteria bacterium]|nr:MAG: hypothetical protein D6761_02645 [Candidatus Dadabacteria bacterium]